MSCACFGPRHSPYSNYICRAIDIAAVGTILFNVFRYDAVTDRDSNLPPSRSVEPRRGGKLDCKSYITYPRSLNCWLKNLGDFNLNWIVQSRSVKTFPLKTLLYWRSIFKDFLLCLCQAKFLVSMFKNQRHKQTHRKLNIVVCLSKIFYDPDTNLNS